MRYEQPPIRGKGAPFANYIALAKKSAQSRNTRAVFVAGTADYSVSPLRTGPSTIKMLMTNAAERTEHPRTRRTLRLAKIQGRNVDFSATTELPLLMVQSPGEMNSRRRSNNRHRDRSVTYNLYNNNAYVRALQRVENARCSVRVASTPHKAQSSCRSSKQQNFLKNAVCLPVRQCPKEEARSVLRITSKCQCEEFASGGGEGRSRSPCRSILNVNIDIAEPHCVASAKKVRKPWDDSGTPLRRDNTDEKPAATPDKAENSSDSESEESFPLVPKFTDPELQRGTQAPLARDLSWNLQSRARRGRKRGRGNRSASPGKRGRKACARHEDYSGAEHAGFSSSSSSSNASGNIRRGYEDAPNGNVKSPPHTRAKQASAVQKRIRLLISMRLKAGSKL